MNDPVHVIGAGGRSGRALVRALVAQDTPVIVIVRNAQKWKQPGLPGEMRVADLHDPATLKEALKDARRIASCAHARYAAAIITAAPPQARLVVLGSTRRFTRWPDDHGNGVIAGEHALLASGRDAVMLHPTMIYGAEGENNVQRLVKLLRRLPFVPLPGGGTALVQPIYQDDVTRAVIGALNIEWKTPQALVIAGPQAVSYADFARVVARAARLPEPRIAPLPAALLIALSPLTLLPGLPRIEPAAIRRLLEDKAFPIEDMVAKLGVRPVALEDGLRKMFG